MLDSIVDLTKARPHMRTSARFPPAELKAFQEGYYTGVVYALRVAEEAIHRYRLATTTIRAGRRKKASA